MDNPNLQTLARELAHKASESESGRAADTVFGGRGARLRQTLVALRSGTSLAEHESPGEATLIVLEGRLRLTSGDDSWLADEGDHLAIPDAPHGVDAETDTVFLLSVSVR